MLLILSQADIYVCVDRERWLVIKLVKLKQLSIGLLKQTVPSLPRNFPSLLLKYFQVSEPVQKRSVMCVSVQVDVGKRTISTSSCIWVYELFLCFLVPLELGTLYMDRYRIFKGTYASIHGLAWSCPNFLSPHNYIVVIHAGAWVLLETEGHVCLFFKPGLCIGCERNPLKVYDHQFDRR